MKDIYENPLCGRYAGKEMQHLFSQDVKFSTWRKLWIALAESEKELGLDISDEQIDEMRFNIHNINYEAAEKYEKELRHDVMAHIHAYGDLCPSARGIIHLGATSCFVGDNTDIIIMDKALTIVKRKLAAVIKELADFAMEYKDMPTLGFTHYQPAQTVTVGKRATLWIQDLYMDIQDLDYLQKGIMLRGTKGTTGTQASFLELFDGDHEKVKRLDALVCNKMGYSRSFPVTGQTYPRKLDARVLNVLSGIAQSAWKFSNDIRLLQNLQEIEEPFGEKQIGSSAMAYKRNPMRSERISSLARYVITISLNPAITASVQWFERTLDDSANKRISVPEAFLATDGILDIYRNIASNMVVYPKIIEKNLMNKLPFMVTENVLMEAVKKGGDRQDLHERIRIHSMEASRSIKEQGKDNDLLERIAADPAFSLSRSELCKLTDPKLFTGRSAAQTEEYIKNEIYPYINNIDSNVVNEDLEV